MREINANELKSIQLDILRYVADFCDANGIKYWLDSGTLIGAVRHGGYIPWDDDIDLGMLREDYTRFTDLFNSSADARYRLFSVQNDPKSPYAFGKVADTQTVLYEPNIKGIQFHVNIDIFIYDLVPEDDNIIRNQYRRRDLFNALNVTKYHGLSYSGHNLKDFGKYLLLICSKILLFPFPKNYFAKCIDRNAKRFMHLPSARIGNFYGFARYTAPKALFDEMMDKEFEGQLFKIPTQYHEWLTIVYGDYMQLPPESERHTHHEFVAFVQDDP